MTQADITIPSLTFETMTSRHYDIIYSFIQKNYIEDESSIARIFYSQDFWYWYLHYVPNSTVIGLTYNNVLIGIGSYILIDHEYSNYKQTINNKIPYINFICVQKKMRKHGLGKMIFNKIKSTLSENNYKNYICANHKNLDDVRTFCKIADYVIPINYQKLRDVKILNEELDPLPIIENNCLHLVKKEDIPEIVYKLNKYLDKYLLRPIFTKDNCYAFIMPKKNIVYSFCKKNGDVVTDFINVYINNLYCIDYDVTLVVAQLGFYFINTMSLTELVKCLLDKLSKYGIDQLVYRNTGDNSLIKITCFTTNIETHLCATDIISMKPDQFIFFPF